MEFAENIIPFAGLLFIWAIGFIVLRVKRQRMDIQRDIQIALLNKFSSGDEMTRFLASEGGRVLVDHLTVHSNGDPRRYAAGLVIGGCVMAALSIGFTGLAFFGGEKNFVIPAVINGALAAGIFAGLVFSLHLSKKLGLIRDR